MPRKSKQHLEPSQFTPILWAVLESYTFGTDEKGAKVIVGSGADKCSYDISNTGKQEELFKRFAAIQHETEALEWIQEFGIPWESSPFLSGTTPNSIEVSDFIDAVSLVRHIKRVHEEIREAVLTKSVSGLAEYLFLIQSNPDHYSATFVPYEDECTPKVTDFCKDLDIIRLGSLSFANSPRFGPSYQKSEWDKAPDQWTLIAARTFLKCVMDTLLSGVRPSQGWRWNHATKQWDLVPSFLVSDPGQAIALELYRQITGTSAFRKCRKTDCFQMGIWPRNRYCCSEAHRKWCERYLGSTRKNKRSTSNKQEERR